MISLLHDFRHAFRNLVRSPGYTLLAVATLALGIGATTAIFSLVDAVLFRPLPVRDPDRLVRVFARVEGSTDLSNSSFPLYEDYRDLAGSFASLAAYADFVPINLEIPGRAVERLTTAIVTGNYFETLGVRPAAGRLLTTSDDGPPGRQPVMVISERLWRSRLAKSPGAPGRSLRVNGHPFRIVGVAPAGALLSAVRETVRGLDPDLPLYQTMTLEEYVGQALAPARILALSVSTFGGLALLLSALGLYGVVAQAVQLRRREFGVRMALGAGRGGILRLVLRRALGVSAIGLAAGLGPALVLAPLASSFLFGVEPRDPAVFTAAASTLALAALAASFQPALRATRVDPMEAIRSE